jgi:hypothetical protein
MSDLITHPKINGVTIEIIAEAEQMKIEALMSSKGIQTVDDGFEATIAAEAQSALRHLIKGIEESRKDAKAPVLEIGRQIDGVAKDYIEDVKAEESRIAQLLGAFQIVERDKKIAAERQARIQEQQVMAEAAQLLYADSDNTDLLDDAQAHIATLRKEAASKHDAVAGVKVRKTIKFEVESEAKLMAARPDLFSPNESKIRAALKLTITIPGIKAWEEIKAY